MPLHPQAADFLDRRARERVRPDHELDVADVRARADTSPSPDRLEAVSRIEGRRAGWRAPLPALQVLIYPPVYAVAYRDPDAYPSYRENGTGYGPVYADGLHYWGQYGGPDATRRIPTPHRSGPRAWPVCPPRTSSVSSTTRTAPTPTPSGPPGWPSNTASGTEHLAGLLGDPATYDDAEPALDGIAAAVRLAWGSG